MSYQGGKQRLGKKIYNIIKNYDDGTLDYLEPFVGICGVMKHMTKGNPLRNIKIVKITP